MARWMRCMRIGWQTDFGCRRKRNGKRQREAESVDNGSRGAILSQRLRQITTGILTIILTIWGRTATTQLGALAERQSERVRRDLLRRTVMDCTTWLEMLMSGAGIGIPEPGRIHLVAPI